MENNHILIIFTELDSLISESRLSHSGKQLGKRLDLKPFVLVHI